MKTEEESEGSEEGERGWGKGVKKEKGNWNILILLLLLYNI